jgi:2-oxoisovalerate dehydrogenase E1 component beta subunit
VSVIPWITYSDAITEALRVEMRRDRTIVCLTASANGRGRPTDQLVTEFGSSRVREHDGGPSILAAAAAAASEGLRPVCELELGALREAGVERLHEAASSGALVVRLVADGSAWPGDAGVNGLKSVSPATAADAKGLLSSAIQDQESVLFHETPDLYSVVCDGVPEGAHLVALGEARLVRRGSDAVVFAHGAASVAAERAAQDLGGEVGVVDVRSLSPLDREAVGATVRETGKVLIVTEPGAPPAFTATLVRLIYEELPRHLDAPIRELGGPAWSRTPNDRWVEDVKEACNELVAF